MSTSQTLIREQLVDYLRRQIVGPDRNDETLPETPCRVYSSGVLFPRVERSDENEVAIPEDERQDAEHETGSAVLDVSPDGAGADEDDIDVTPPFTPAAPDVDDQDDVVLLSNTYYPAAMGLTFLIPREPTTLVVTTTAAVYESFEVEEPNRKKPARHWRRLPVATTDQSIPVGDSATGTQDRNIAPKLGLRVVWRGRGTDLLVVTVSIFNRHEPRSPRKPPSARQCFFQVGFKVREHGGHPVFQPYDTLANRTEDDEEGSLALLYRKRHQFAVGHGCAPEWIHGDGAEASEVSTETLPSVVVPPVEPTNRGGKALDMFHLAGLDGTPEEEIPESLMELSGAYSRWIDERETEALALEPDLKGTADRHLTTCRQALTRIQGGVALLRENAFVLRAFRLANRAILMQQHHSKQPNREEGDPWTAEPRSYQPSDPGRGKWRSFQLGFILMNLAAFLDEDDQFEDSRKIVDLIWFPTGGGKTEAYLGLAAFAIFLRRILNPLNGGCVVLMRYTLRLLTSQQFQRAASLICACDVIRKEDEVHLGRESISLGLWVGRDASPNDRKAAVAARKQMAKVRPDGERRHDNPFQVLACPWCGTRFDRPQRLGYVATGPTVGFRCPETRCRFSRSNLPITVIDEDIYDSPPTLVLGTVDKFAMLAWKPESSAIFGVGRKGVDPPDLIIQDELHLISGPLGSMVGLYEAAIEYLCTGKHAPKIVASTATIRRAKDQCLALYDRAAFQFPPAGLDVSDSFFAEEVTDSPGRVYLGVFASAAPSPVTALVRTAAALHQGAKSVALPQGALNEHRDPYWTQLQYFGSLRELGRAATLVEQDIPEFLKVIRRRQRLGPGEIRHLAAPVELTSRLTAEQVPEILEDLKVRLTADLTGERRPGKRPIDILLATNMISVGVDVDRLGLMVVVGQPKSTSEYIQASSRVGRSKDAPGLIVSLYNAGKPRDRSHYERFRSYHEGFYRHVEPTSVTPFSIPVLERALHALIVIVARHLCAVKRPDQLRKDDPSISRFLEFLRRRSRNIDPEHAVEVISRVEAALDHWQRFAPSQFGSLSPFDPGGNRLLIPSSTRVGDNDDAAWRTPTSMRNVDAECAVEILQLPFVAEGTP